MSALCVVNQSSGCHVSSGCLVVVIVVQIDYCEHPSSFQNQHHMPNWYDNDHLELQHDTWYEKVKLDILDLTWRYPPQIHRSIGQNQKIAYLRKFWQCWSEAPLPLASLWRWRTQHIITTDARIHWSQLQHHTQSSGSRKERTEPQVPIGTSLCIGNSPQEPNPELKAEWGSNVLLIVANTPVFCDLTSSWVACCFILLLEVFREEVLLRQVTELITVHEHCSSKQARRPRVLL